MVRFECRKRGNALALRVAPTPKIAATIACTSLLAGLAFSSG
jgi:hypothetical protein